MINSEGALPFSSSYLIPWMLAHLASKPFLLFLHFPSLICLFSVGSSCRDEPNTEKELEVEKAMPF